MDNSINYTVSDAAASSALAGGLFAFLAAYLVFVLILVAVIWVSLWKIFVKAGKPGWAAIVPIYNFYIILEIVGRPTWWLAALLLGFIPFVGSIALIVVSIIVAIDLAKSFGKDTGFGILLALLPIVGYPMLAFGKDIKYVGPSVKPSAPTTPTATQ